jgi:hypothetical protein
MVIGGIAIIARGLRRMTTDIDVVVRGDETSWHRLARAEDLVIFKAMAARPKITRR